MISVHLVQQIYNEHNPAAQGETAIDPPLTLPQSQTRQLQFESQLQLETQLQLESQLQLGPLPSLLQPGSGPASSGGGGVGVGL